MPALASCSLEENTAPVSDPRIPMTFYAGPDDSPAAEPGNAGADTRTSFHPEAGNAVYWSDGDAIRVFDGSRYDNEFTLVDGAGSAAGTFAGLAVPEAGTYYALYPYSSEAALDGTSISAVLPAGQTYTAGSFATMLNPSVAKTAEGGDRFVFSNVASLIQVTNATDKTVSGIRIDAASIAGAYTVDMTGEPFVAVPASEGSLSAVTLSSEDGSGFGSGPYYLVVLPGTYPEFKVTVSFSDGTAAEKSYADVEVKAGGGRSLTVTDSWEFSGKGDGSEADPYRIYNAADLLALAGNLKEGSVTYAVLADNIDMAGTEWAPMVAGTDVLKSIDFDGGGNRISNLTIDGEYEFASFFGVLNGSVRDLIFENPSVTSGLDAVSPAAVVAAQAGSEEVSTTLDNITVSGASLSVTKAQASPAGLLVGKGRNLTVSDCSVEGILVHGGANAECNVGGFIGQLDEGCSITGCESDAMSLLHLSAGCSESSSARSRVNPP